MTNSLSSGVAWVLAHPTRKNVTGAKYRIGYGWSWSQLCVALVFWAVGATETWGTANIARSHSKIVSESRTPPDGAIGWFTLGSAGHVGFFKGGVMWSATKWASNLGTALGTLTITEYENLSGAEWVGWGWDFGGQTFTGITTAGTGTVTPITDPNMEDVMQFFLDPTLKNTDGKSNLYWAFEGGVRRKFTGTQAQASAFVTYAGITTKTPDVAEWAAICAAYPVATTGGASVDVSGLATTTQLAAAEAALTATIGKIPPAPSKFVAAP